MHRWVLAAEVRAAMLAQRDHLAEARVPEGAHEEEVVRDAVHSSFVRAFRVTTLASAALAGLSAFGALLIPRLRIP